MRNFFTTVLALSIILIANATPDDSNGVVKGTVQESLEGQSVPVPFANVFLAGTSIGGSTDFDGHFEFSASPGTYQLIVSSLGYVADTIEIIVTAGSTIETAIEVSPDAQILEMVQIEAKMDRESETLLLMEQKNASTITQSIGASELSNKGASDVEQGLTKVSGITRSTASSDIFVRGLGDRYNNATLNGLPIPSSNPDKKVIQLSIFPTSVVKSIDVNKTFTPDLQSDFAGANIDIYTKDYYEDPFAQVGFNVSMNSITTFKDFERAQGSSYSILGNQSESRNLPSSISSGYERSYYSSPADDATPVFQRSFNPILTKAAPNYGYSVLGGDATEVGKDGKLGFLVSAEQSSGYQYREGYSRNTDSSGVDKNYFATQTFDYNTQTTGLANVHYEINRRNSIQVNGLYTNSTNDQVSNYDSQILDRDRNTYTYSTRNTLRIYSLYTAQVLGKHETKNERFLISWGGSYNLAKNDEPDRTQLLFEASDASKSDYRLEALNASDNHRFFSSLSEEELNGRVDVRWKFKQDQESGKALGAISAGFQPRMKTRTFEWRQFNMSMRQYADSLQNNHIIVDQLNPDAFLGDDAYSAGLYSYEEARDGSRTHFVQQNILASYIMLDYTFGSRLTMIGGARIEKTNQVIQYKQLRNLLSDPYQVKQYDTLNILPSFSLKYELNELSNLRFALSQTVSRPNFRELAPFQYQDQSRRLYEGNIDLVNAYSYNADLKYEIFPSASEVFAVSAFGKYIDKPIERYEVPSSTSLFTYFNLGRAIVAGVETEIKTTLGRFIGTPSIEQSRIIDRVSLGLNLAYNYTQLYVGSESPINTTKGTILATNSKRQMQGASPYLVSSDIGYEFSLDQIKSRWSLVYNVFGPRVFIAGTYGRGDVHEKPVSTLDLVMKNQIGDRIDLNFSIKNILNPKIVQEQINAGEAYVFNEYRLGTTFGASLNYRFFKSEI